MGAILLLPLVAASIAVWRAKLPAATATLLAVLFLVPGNLVLPGLPSAIPVFRIVLWGFVAGLAVRIRRGEVDLDAVRPSRVQVALTGFVVVALVNGVALNGVGNPLLGATLHWFSYLDQLLVLTAVLVAARVLGPWRVARMAAVAAVAMGCIAFVEHFTETSYARWFYQQFGKAGIGVPAEPLTPRGDQVRVRGPYQFALEFSWVAVMVLPIVTVVAVRARQRLALLGPAVLGAALLWSWSRSSLAGVAIAAAVLILTGRFDRRTLMPVVVGVLVCLVVILASPGVGDPFDAADDDSAASRTRRVAIITEALTDDPWTGLGLAGLPTLGVDGADASFTLAYATLGVPGMLALGVAQVAAVVGCAAGLRDRRHRLLAAAALAGCVGGVVGSFALDLVAVPGSGKTFWVIAGLGVAATSSPRSGDRATGPPALRWRLRWVAVPVAAMVGGAVAALWPSHAAATYRFESIEPAEVAVAITDLDYGGRYLINTACDLTLLAADRQPDADAECLVTRASPGFGTIRVTAADVETAERAARSIEDDVRDRLPGFVLHVVHAGRGRPTLVRTAPIWLPGLAVAGAALVPGRIGGGGASRRRSDRDHTASVP